MRDNFESNKIIFTILKISVYGFLLFLFILNFLIMQINIVSSSMENTLMTNESYIAYKTDYFLEKPKRKDVIIFRWGDTDTTVAKRIIGLPNDKVEIKDGKVYINDSNKYLDEPYVLNPESFLPQKDGIYEVPEGTYFLLGDNRLNSRDSRYWSNPYIKEKRILGKLKFGFSSKFKLIK